MTHACHSARPGVEVDDLAFSEQFLVWAMRAWVDGYKTGIARAGLLREGFALAGAGDAWLVIEELMSIAAGTARRPLDVRCLACRQLGDDEALLLAAVAGLQRSDPAPAAAMLADWLPPAGACRGLVLLDRLATDLVAARMRLPLSAVQSRRDPGLALVH